MILNRFRVPIREHSGAGYRIYFGKKGAKIVLLLLGGDKSNQKKDIKGSSQFWEEYLGTQ